MKLNGVTPKANEEILVLPRPDGNLVFKARALTGANEFEKVCPVPQPPKGRNNQGVVVENYNDPEYKAAVKARADKEYDYMMIACLSATEGLEWEKVNIGDPTTYHFWEEELQDAGFTVWEIGRIKSTVLTVNGLNQAKIDEAKASFLANQVAP